MCMNKIYQNLSDSYEDDLEKDNEDKFDNCMNNVINPCNDQEEDLDNCIEAYSMNEINNDMIYENDDQSDLELS